MDRPHVVLIHRYFAPDTPPYATILRRIALGLAEGGMDVEVLTCQPSYNAAVVDTAPAYEQINSHVVVTRWPVIQDRRSSIAKIANLVIFGARVVRRLATIPRVDVIMAASTPPVMIAMLASMMAKIRGARFVYHNQDLYPEVAEVIGGLPAAAVGILKRLDTATDHRSDRIVVLSEDMRRTLSDRGVDRAAVAIINNFDPWTLRNAEHHDYEAPTETIRFVYAGNLGSFQNLEAVAEMIARSATDDRFTFDFIGDGPLRPWLQQFVRDHNLQQVRLHGYLGPEILADKLQSAYDVGIVSLHPGVIRCAYPSKMMSYIRNGLPVLALVERDSELVEVVGQYKSGWTADPSDALGVMRTLDGLWEDRERLPIMRDEARRMYHTEFGEAGQISSWVRMFDDLVRGS